MGSRTACDSIMFTRRILLNNYALNDGLCLGSIGATLESYSSSRDRVHQMNLTQRHKYAILYTKLRCPVIVHYRSGHDASRKGA